MKKPKFLRPLSPARALLGLAATGLIATQSFAAGSDVLARIGSAEITADNLQPYLANLGPDEKAALLRDPSSLTQFVRSLLVQQLLLKEAQAKNWDKQPDIQEQLERARQSAIADSYLRSLVQPPEGFPNDAEVQSFYDANQESLVVPRRLQLAQIFLALPKNADKTASDAVQAQLDALQKGLKQSGSDFAALAAAESDDPQTAARGGEIGWLAENQIQPAIRDAVAKLAKNGISQPVRLDDGWHILKVLDIKEAGTPPLDEIRPQLVQQLKTVRIRANSEAYLAKLLQQNPVTINEIGLTQLVEAKAP